MPHTIATLFSGGEGVGVGARQAGLDHLWGVEFDPALAAVAERNGFRSIVADVCRVDCAALPRPYHLHASPVCKNASVAKADGGEAPEDIATAQAVCRAIEALRPQVFTLENVRGYRQFSAYAAILATLQANGYGIAEAVLNAADYGVPQTRERLILRAVRGVDRPALPVPTHARPDKLTPLFDTRRPWVGWLEAIADLVDDLPDSAFAPWQVARLPGELRETMLIDGDSGDVRTGAPAMYGACHPAMTVRASRPAPHRAFIVSNAATEYSDGLRAADEPMLSVTAQHGGRVRAVLMNKSQDKFGDGLRCDAEPAHTIQASSHGTRAAVAGRVVRMTPRCLARFQSFPDDYWLPEKASTACTVIGNAVPPLLARRILEVTP